MLERYISPILSARLIGNIPDSLKEQGELITQAQLLPKQIEEAILKNARLAQASHDKNSRSNHQINSEGKSLEIEKICSILESKTSTSRDRWDIFSRLGSKDEVRGNGRLIEVFLRLSHYDDSDIRHCAAHGLLSVGDKSTIPCLLSLLKDSSLEVRQSAAIALSFIPDESSISSLISFFLDPINRQDKENQIFAWGIRSLTQIELANVRGKSLVKELVTLLAGLRHQN